jgi:hypothetical protein
MWEYFKGWRRKLGVLTLVMACVFMTAWVRSRMLVDVVELPWIAIVSNRGILSVVIRELTGASSWRSRSLDLVPERQWDVLLWGFGLWRRQLYEATAIGIPYWFMTISLTLLSAWLLLSAPRVKNL